MLRQTRMGDLQVKSFLRSIFAKNHPLHLIDPQVQAYSERFSSREDDLLQEINHFTSTRSHANMLSGHVQGKFLELISWLLKPHYVLEIGTFMGYSAICLSKGLAEGGQLHTLEIREEDANIAQGYFERANMTGKIILHLGNALDIIPTLDYTWDLVFIDADKPGYLDYYRLVLPRVRSGGLILADNVLFHGEVLGEPVKGKNALAIQAFNEAVKADQSVEKVLLTVRDGLMLIRKK
jgi:caffeoyl-CoA O-methyltransferase